MVSFRDYLLGAAINAGVVSAVGGALMLSLKTWIEKKLDHKFKLAEERAKSYIELNKEVDKARALNLLDRQNTIYPEVSEVVYRLRNALRDIIASFSSERWKVDRGLNRRNLDQIKMFNSGLYLLTENLYKYQVFVEKDVFDNLHRFKRILQDSSVVIDHLTRTDVRGGGNSASPPITSFKDVYDPLIVKLNAIYEESDDLYNKISSAIRENLRRREGP